MTTEEKVIQKVIDLVEANIDKATTRWTADKRINLSFQLRVGETDFFIMNNGDMIEPAQIKIDSESDFGKKMSSLYNRIKEKDMEKLLNELSEVK